MAPLRLFFVFKLFYHDIIVTYFPGTEACKLRIWKGECSPEIWRHDSIEGFSAHNCFGLQKKVDHRPCVRSFQGNSDPLGVYAELTIHFLVRSMSLSFRIGFLEACLLGNWVTVSSWALNPEDWTWIYGFRLVGPTSSGKLGSNEYLASKCFWHLDIILKTRQK